MTGIVAPEGCRNAGEAAGMEAGRTATYRSTVMSVIRQSRPTDRKPTGMLATTRSPAGAESVQLCHGS
jgi:hypothetical protein